MTSQIQSARDYHGWDTTEMKKSSPKKPLACKLRQSVSAKTRSTEVFARTISVSAQTTPVVTHGTKLQTSIWNAQLGEHDTNISTYALPRLMRLREQPWPSTTTSHHSGSISHTSSPLGRQALILVCSKASALIHIRRGQMSSILQG